MTAPPADRSAPPPHLEDLSVGVYDIHGDFDVLLDALPSPLKVASLKGEVQVVADVTCDGKPGSVVVNQLQVM